MSALSKPVVAALVVLVTTVAIVTGPATGRDTGGDSFEAESAEQHTVGGPDGPGWNLWSNGSLTDTLTFDQGPNHVVTVWARANTAGQVLPIMELRIDEVVVGRVDVRPTTDWSFEQYLFPVTVDDGEHAVTVAYVNDPADPAVDVDLVIDRVAVAAADDPSPEPPSTEPPVPTTDPSSTTSTMTPTTPPVSVTVTTPDTTAPTTAPSTTAPTTTEPTTTAPSTTLPTTTVPTTTVPTTTVPPSTTSSTVPTTNPPGEPGDQNYCSAEWRAAGTKRATPSTLGSVLADARAGDIILLADGRYTGFTVSADGTAEQPVVIRAENPQQATVDVGQSNVSLSGDHTVFACFDVVGNSGGQVGAYGDHARVTRNVLSDPGRRGNASIVFANGPNVRIDHNDFGGQLPLRRTGIRLKWGANQNARVDHNYFHDSPNEGGDNDVEYEAIWISTDPILDFTLDQRVTIDHNLFENWEGDNEVISSKSSSNLIINNTLLNSKEFSLRGGRNNTVKNNIIDNSAIVAYDTEQQIIGNLLINGSKIDLRPGKASSGHTASNGAIVAGNQGGVINVGGDTSDQWDSPAVNNRLGNNDSQVRLLFERNTDTSYEYDGDIGEPAGVDRNQVGPLAP